MASGRFIFDPPGTGSQTQGKLLASSHRSYPVPLTTKILPCKPNAGSLRSTDKVFQGIIIKKAIKRHTYGKQTSKGDDKLYQNFSSIN